MSGPQALRRALITGGAGFIGSHLADRLHAEGVDVVVYDDFSTGQLAFLRGLSGSARVRVVEGDVLDTERLADAMAGCDVVFHLAANADVRFGLDDPSRDLSNNTLGTASTLEAMRGAGIRRIVFSSTGSVYGEPVVIPTPEDCPFPVQTSLYGASKLAGEALIQAYCEGYGFAGGILRFVSVLGERYTHGHLIDFYRSLLADPTALTVLGNGRQRKSYLYVRDCVEAILMVAIRHPHPGPCIYNVGTDEVTTVDKSVELVCAHLRVRPDVRHTGGQRGWVGDSPFIHLDCMRLRGLGWRPTHTIRQAIDRTLGWLDANRWVLEARGAR